MTSSYLIPLPRHTVDAGAAQTTSSQPAVLSKAHTHSADNIYESMKGRDSRSGDESTPHFLTNPLYGAVESESTFQGSHDKVSPTTSPVVLDNLILCTSDRIIQALTRGCHLKTFFFPYNKCIDVFFAGEANP